MVQQTTALFDACETGNLSAVVFALENGDDLNAVNEIEDSPLVVAIASHSQERQQDIVRLLIDNGADANFLGDENCGVVFQSVLLKDLIIMEMVSTVGANSNFQLDQFETLYDYAEFDYRFDAFDLELPIEPTDIYRERRFLVRFF